MRIQFQALQSKSPYLRTVLFLLLLTSGNHFAFAQQDLCDKGDLLLIELTKKANQDLRAAGTGFYQVISSRQMVKLETAVKAFHVMGFSRSASFSLDQVHRELISDPWRLEDWSERDLSRTCRALNQDALLRVQIQSYVAQVNHLTSVRFIQTFGSYQKRENAFGSVFAPADGVTVSGALVLKARSPR